MLNKKYALPQPAIDIVVKHFVQFRNEKTKLPLLWHQALLVLAQRYRDNIQPEQRDQLKLLLRQHSHYAVTPEIRRELFNASSNTGEDEYDEDDDMDDDME